jgi:hypothetical protein
MHFLNVFSESEVDYFVVLELVIHPPYLMYHNVGLLAVHVAYLVPLQLNVAPLLLELHHLLPRLL